jgi:N-methylhydantoinase A
MSRDSIAAGIIDIVNSNMARAVRVMTVERGFDPREFTLVTYGGAGPLHACDLADELGISQVLIPMAPGGLCALGALVADFRFDFVRTRMLIVNDETSSAIRATFKELRDVSADAITQLGISDRQINTVSVIDMRYLGQNYELPIPADDYQDERFLAKVLQRFHQEHERVYGYAQPEALVQAVSYRLTATIPSLSAKFKSTTRVDSGSGSQESERKVYLPGTGWRSTRVIDRSRLSGSVPLPGPLIIEQSDTTIMVSQGWNARADGTGNLVLHKDA